MNRRNFLKVIATVGAAAAVPVTALAEIGDKTPQGALELGLVRETFGYDIVRDEILVRYDIWHAGEELQLAVDTTLRGHYSEGLRANRKVALELLENELKHRGLKWSDLTPLPLPKGYAATEYGWTEIA